MAADKHFLNDIARVAGGAASLLSTVRRQVQSDLKERVGAYASKMQDDGSNSDIERLTALVSKLRLEQEDLKKRVAALETGPKAKTKAAAPKKPAVKAKRK